ncbi:DUF4175 family protein [Fodinibius halophilus]|uniref:DUF4175 family protein n=1 Tax=Fodinibius halophilus TaxID=1736908 RepID=A0A6M1T6Z1_9BACT|nr:DUF4175 family protein [Fodinibius halophilus]NGP87791.1 hypothetical protein [Fodinibius halophilus]
MKSPSKEPTYQMMQQYLSVLKKHYRQLLRKQRLSVALLFFAVLLLGFFIAGITELFFYLPAPVKITVGLTLLVLASIAVYLLYHRLESPTFKQFYQRFCSTHALPQLSDALDLYHDSENKDRPLQQAAIKQNTEQLNPEEVEAKIKHFLKQHPSYKYYQSGIAGLAGTLLLFITLSTLQPGAVNRMAHVWINYTPPNPYSFTIEPGTTTIEQGESIIPRIIFEDEIPENLSLAFKTDIENDYRKREATQINENQASFAPISLTTSGRYYFNMDGFKSPTHQISVQLRPRLEQLTVHIIPPSYTRLDTSSYSYPFSQIKAYQGSRLALSATTNKAISELEISHSARTDTVLHIDNSSDSLIVRDQWEITQPDTVSFNMADEAGLSNKNKFRFVVNPRRDRSPFVNITAPENNIQMKTAEDILIQYEAGDDFGLTSATLNYELQQAFKKEPEHGSISLGRPSMSKQEQYRWAIPELNPKPRDVITYWIEVTDNDGYNGYKTGRSQKMVISFPSMTEYMDELETEEEKVTESLDDISESFEQMEREYDEFKEKLKKNPETNWEQKKQLQQVEQERQKIDKKVDDLNKKFEQIREEIEKSHAMSPETLKAYDELQKLMKEINNPELQKALEELQKSLGEMSPDEMRKALENYEFNEEIYKQRINRTKELFKTLKLNSDLDKMAKSLEELAKQEKEVSESEQSPAEDLEQQKAIQDDFEQLREQLEQLDKNAPEKTKDRVQKLKETSQQRMEQTKQKLQENIEKLQKQQQAPKSDPKTRQQQQNIQKQMQQMAQQMRSAKQQMSQQRKKVNSRALEYILYSLINLSTNQEELTRETENLPPRSRAFVTKARKEKNISQQFTVLSDSLYKLSSEIPSFSNRINKKKVEIENKLSRAVNTLSERDKSNSIYTQRQSLGGINELSSMIASLLEQLQNQQNGGSGGGMSMQQMIEQMQKMSGQQQKLNQQIQNMINDIQGNRLSKDQTKRLNQLSKQQNRIRKQLKKMQQSGELESGDRVLSELERMSDQMEDAINDLRGGQLDQQLMQRQQNILSRMLSAEKAVQERGKEDRREATTAKEQQQSSSPDITLEELQQRIRKMLNDPNRTKFSEDYQRLIEQYFELLEEQENGVIN